MACSLYIYETYIIISIRNMASSYVQHDSFIYLSISFSSSLSLSLPLSLPLSFFTHEHIYMCDMATIGCTFRDGYCKHCTGFVDWFEVDLGFTELLFIQIGLCDLCVLGVILRFCVIPSVIGCTYITNTYIRWVHYSCTYVTRVRGWIRIWHRISRLFLKHYQRTRILPIGFAISTT